MTRSSEPMPRVHVPSQRDRGAEHRDLCDRAHAHPGVAEVLYVYGAYQAAMTGARVHQRVAVPTSRAAADTSR